MTKEAFTRIAQALLKEFPRTSQPDLPNPESARAFAKCLIPCFFPQVPLMPSTKRLGKPGSREGHAALESRQKDQEKRLKVMVSHLRGALNPLSEALPEGSAQKIAQKFLDDAPKLQKLMRSDLAALYQGDPAAKSESEIILSYPGFFASAVYRAAHHLHVLKVPLFPRLLTEYAHEKTGIDIHPAARIGHSFCIDHGTGVVIGETSVLGNHVKLYQGVTLGALSVDKSLSHTKRHPTLEDEVVVYSNATILGGETVIGRGSVIGGNVWLTSSVPPFSTVYHRGDVSVRSSKPRARKK